MAIPKNVQRQLENAEALQAAQAASAAPPNLVTDVSQLSAPAPAAEAPAAVPAPPAPAPAVPTENWEQKFRTLQGMFNAEVPALRAQNKSYESDIASLRDQVKALQAAVQKPAEPQVDERDAKMFGQDLVEMVQRYSRAAYEAIRTEFAGQAQQMESRIAQLEELVNGVSQKTETTLESQFYATLARLVPDWESVNADVAWRQWLAESDPVYRVARQVALDMAHQKLDADGVAAVFNAFKATRPAKPAETLDGQVNPGSTGGSEPPQPEVRNTQLISQQVVNNFYTDVAKGRYRGREAEQARLEAEINQAAIEGRIV